MASRDVNVKLSLTDNLTAGLDKASGSVNKFGKNAKRSFAEAENASKTFAKALAVMGAAITAMAGLSVKEFATFEKGMSKVKAITGTTGKEFTKMTDLAKTLGRTTAFTAAEASEAMVFLGMAGFDAIQIMEALPSTLDLAAASGLGLGRSADIVSNVMQQFGADTSRTTHFVDVLAKTTTSSNTNMEELAEAMNFLAPTMKSLGGEVEEAAATIGILANAGLKGSMASSVLQTALIRLSSPTNAMRKGMSTLGLQAFDTSGNFVGLTDVIRQLEVGTKGLTQQQKAQAIGQVFGVRAFKQFNVLLDAGSDKLAKYTKALKESDGVAKQMAETMLDNLAGAWTIFTSAVSGLKIEIGSGLSPVLSDLLNQLTFLVLKTTNTVVALGGFTKWFEQNKILISIIAGSIAGALTPAIIALTVSVWGLVASLAPFIVAGGVVAGVVVFLMEAFDSFIKMLEETGSPALILIGGTIFGVVAAVITLTTVLAALQILFGVQALNLAGASIASMTYATATGVATAATWAFNTAMAVLTSPITLVVIAIGAVIAAVVFLTITLIKNFDKIKSAFSRVMEKVSQVSSDVWDKIKSGFSDAIDWIVNLFHDSKDWVINAFSDMFDGIVGIAKGIFNTVMGVIEGFINSIVNGINLLIKAANTVNPFSDIPLVQKISFQLFSSGGIAGVGKQASMAGDKFGKMFAGAAKFATGGIVQGFGGEDTQPALLTPGEMILTQEQQKNLFNMAKGTRDGGGINITISGNSFFGDDERFADKIGNMIVEQFRQNYNFEHFSFK